MMQFKQFQPTLFDFLEQLADNNNRPWFQENIGRYDRDVLEPALAFVRVFQPRLKRISRYFVASDRRADAVDWCPWGRALDCEGADHASARRPLLPQAAARLHHSRRRPSGAQGGQGPAERSAAG